MAKFEDSPELKKLKRRTDSSLIETSSELERVSKNIVITRNPIFHESNAGFEIYCNRGFFENFRKESSDKMNERSGLPGKVIIYEGSGEYKRLKIEYPNHDLHIIELKPIILPNNTEIDFYQKTLELSEGLRKGLRKS